MLEVEPEEVINNRKEDAQNKNSEFALGDDSCIKHHVQSDNAYGQIEEVRPDVHHEESQDRLKPESPPSKLKPWHYIVASSFGYSSSSLI